MSQVTIYLEEETLALAKAAAARAKMSLSKWFAQFAEAEKTKPKADLGAFMDELDRAYGTEGRNDFDFLLDPKTRYADLAPQRELEPF
jgi:hypothetical protein